MSFVEILGDVLRYHGLVFLERVQIAVALFRRDLEANMEQLPQMRVVRRVSRIVPKRGHKLRRAPAIDDFLRRQFRAVNVDDRRIRSAQFVGMIQRFGVNLLRQRQSVAARLGQADQFFQPRGAGGLDVQAGAEFGAGRGGWARRSRTCRCRSGR